ncbi:MAG: UMP kinase [Candidatus Thermoplasmatota archaeon]|nr:UMP kinase [Candidatus Thermoplasmatota archaeon]
MRLPQVIALGGSLLRPEESENRKIWFGKLRQLAVHIEGNSRKLGIVVGGGLPAREGIELASNLISDSDRLDEVGIAATRINATIIQQILIDIGCNVAPSIPHNTVDAAQCFEEYNIVVMGGTTPGHTTDAVAISLARDCGARDCIIATNVSHIFDKDPKVSEDAKPFVEMTIHELIELIGTDRMEPGQSAVVDPIAVGLAEKSQINIAVLDGRDIDLIESALDGKEFEGTLVRS